MPATTEAHTSKAALHCPRLGVPGKTKDTPTVGHTEARANRYARMNYPLPRGPRILHAATSPRPDPTRGDQGPSNLTSAQDTNLGK